ncbi:MAG: quinone-dependent dihydroorotate dehydrogenase, partial [Patescibacteria group bacterium]|nr:quinone-dependent dihydroorotate dehydrogenase [Patescibacteria group bacterium]
MYQTIVRPLMFVLSREDPEEAHILAKRLLKWIQASPNILAFIEYLNEARRNSNPVVVAGVTFPNRVGLAAGFDKNAEMLLALQALGFGFIEVGTVLPRYQKGSDRPRLFRFPKHLLNRMGFNSDGVDAVIKNLESYGHSIRVPLIGSLGKMKETPNDDAADDYVEVLRKIRRFVKILTANVSSPNTPDLRKLQGKAYLENLGRQLIAAERDQARKERSLARPIFVKVAPDLTEQEIEETVGAAVDGGISGFIATNTTTDPAVKRALGTSEAGGVSGDLLFLKSLRVVKLVKQYAPKLPLIGVGGINSTERAEVML